MSNLAKIEEIYHQALQIPFESRDEFLRDSCGDDNELRNEIESLLSFDEQAKDFIETPPIDVAANLITQQNKEKLIGREFSHYRIIEKLGAGGMGEVYLAEDTKLNRRVALKLLPLQFSQDTERRKRFEKEARAVSALNHPNIITIFGVEQTEDFNFIATELVEGKTLRELIAEKPLSPKETIEIGIQIADALDSAHSLGIIHRDIKPANIMIRQDGIVKVLDFGLAKLVESAELGVGSKDIFSPDSRLPTPDSRLTKAEAVMGTINYMSPEQALGETVDFRTDIFSFGVVLYEMLSSAKPFDGVSDAAVYNATINYNPQSLSELNNEIPLALEKIIFHAIEKKRAERYQTISELKRDLQELKENPTSDLFAKKFAIKRKSNLVRLAIPIIAIIALASIAYFLIFNRSSKQTAESKNFTYTQLTSKNGEELFPNLSPDGKSFLYSSRESGNWDIYLKRIGETVTINLTKDSLSDEIQGAFSPDGGQIAFRSQRNGGGIFVMNADGKNVRQITDTGFYPNWSADGKEIVYCTSNFPTPGERPTYPSELWRVEIASGNKHLITKNDAVQPNWSPNGFRVAFWGLKDGSQRDIWTISADGGEVIPVTDDAATDWNPFWSPDGKFLYFVSNRSGSMNLWRVGVDEKSGKLLGKPEAVTIPTNYSQFLSFGRQGNFIYSQAAIDFNLWRVGFNSESETIDKKAVQVTNDSLIKTDPNISPDDKSLLFASVGSQTEDLYLANSDGSAIHPLTETPFKERLPVWSPDGKRIAFVSNRSGGDYEGWLINPDGSNLRMITPSVADNSMMIPVWSPDGKSLLFSIGEKFPMIFDSDKNADEQTPTQLPANKGKNSYMATSWSPDGKKIAGYSSIPNSTKDVITIYDFATQQYRDLTDLGGLALWLNDSRRLIFCNNDKVFLLDTQTGKLKELLSVKPSIIDSISISKDNRSIYYSVRKKESDIWLAKVQE